jgi:hypothetical protein
MLKIIKYLSYNKNKSKKNYNKCTKFKVLINFITNSYLLGIQKVQKLKMMKVQKLKMMKKDRDPPRRWWKKTAIPQEIAWIS